MFKLAARNARGKLSYRWQTTTFCRGIHNSRARVHRTVRANASVEKVQPFPLESDCKKWHANELFTMIEIAFGWICDSRYRPLCDVIRFLLFFAVVARPLFCSAVRDVRWQLGWVPVAGNLSAIAALFLFSFRHRFS